MDRIAETFERCRGEGRPAFIAYVCAGDPDFETSLAVCRTLLEGGVDMLELGVPFSDPLADGLTNQLAAQRALRGGMTHARVFELVRRIREFSEAPLVFYTYYNLVYSQGTEPYLKTAKMAGVDGVLTLDCPPEEAGELTGMSRALDLRNIFIVAPTTGEARIARIAQAASGFIYYVSREGVTGERESLSGSIGEAVARIRGHTELPVVVGFGISTAGHVRAVGAVADGVVVGSALVNVIARHAPEPGKIPEALGARLRELLAGLRGPRMGGTL